MRPSVLLTSYFLMIVINQVWPCEDALDPAFTPALFSLAIDYFCENTESPNRFVKHICEVERNPELSSGAREVIITVS